MADSEQRHHHIISGCGCGCLVVAALIFLALVAPEILPSGKDALLRFLDGVAR